MTNLPTQPPYLKREYCTVRGEGRDIYDYDDEEYARNLQHREESMFYKPEEITNDDKESEQDE